MEALRAQGRRGGTAPIIEIPEPAASLAREWGFVPTAELEPGFCSRVFVSEAQVLKCPFQGEEITHGAWAARQLARVGGVAVLHADDASGTLLMPRIVPGTPLHSGADEPAARTVFIEFAQRVRTLDPSDAIPLATYIEEPSPLSDRLLCTSPAPCFLHGDLHHENIRLGAEGWVMIDAKGLVGDPAYEPVAFLRNPLDSLETFPDLAGRARSRIDEFAIALELDPWRIWAWALVDALQEAEPSPGWLRWQEALQSLEGTWPEFTRAKSGDAS